MKIYNISDKKFGKYGKAVGGDFTELLNVLRQKQCPENGTIYVPSDNEMESLPVFGYLQDECFGGLPIQIGYCNGSNDTLGCLEHHKSNEIDIADNDIVLLLGDLRDINDGKYDTGNVKAFFVPAGQAVELYATTLHYAPCGKSFRVAVVLPKGTNCDAPSGATDPILRCNNKWLFAHSDSPEAKQGAYIGLTGKNIKTE